MNRKENLLRDAEGYLRRAEAFIEQASDAERALSDVEKKQIERLHSDAAVALHRAKGADISAELAEFATTPQKRMTQPIPPDNGEQYGDTRPATAPDTWRDSRGAPVRAYKSNQSFAQEWRHSKRFERDTPADWSAGRYIKALLTGDRKYLSDAENRAMSESVNASGGFAVPEPVAAAIIDKARALSVLNKVGAITVPMQTETLRLARIASDWTFEGKAENAAFSGSDAGLDAVTLVSRTIGQVTYASRELVEDSANFEQQIESAFAKSLATELDRLGLRGSGASGEPLGIMNGSEVQTTGSISSVAWADLLAAIEDVRDKNAEPEAYILPPALATSFDSLVTGDGTNSAKFFWPAPATVAALSRYVSNQCASGEIYVGGFRDNAIIGLRQDARLEVTTTGGDTFAKHQIGLKLAWRGDFAALHHDQLVKLTGAS